MLELDDGGIFAIEFNELVAPTLNPLDNVMASVISGWENEEIEKRLTAIADDLMARIDSGEEITSLGYSANQELDVLRDGRIEGMPLGFIQTLFTMDKGAAQIVDGNGAVFLVQLNDILPPDPENPDLATIETEMETAISQALSQDIFTAFNGALQNQAGVYVNSAAVNAVHSQFPQ